VERRTGCPRGAGPSTGCVGCAGNQQIGRGRLEIPRRWVMSRDGVVARTSTQCMLHTRHDPHSRGSRLPATNLTAPHAPRATCTWPCTAIAALPALLMVVGRRLRFYGSSRCTCERGRNGPCFAFRPSDFPCAYAGSDGCHVFTLKTSPVKWCGLYTGAAARGRSVPLEEVHLAEIQA
jgi:hypothetical protein